MVDIPGYRIVRMLGKGGMASVHLAIQESFGRKVALKVMNPALSADVKFGQRFLSEAKIVSQLIHPNIVTVYDVGINQDQHYLSMEYVPGLDLKTKRTSLTIEESLRVVKDVAKALDYASMKGYVHRDVKPENIMLHDEDGRAVLMDFGIACLADKSSGMTQTGTAIGTPHYMSPEQAKGRAVDSRSDLYSLGVVLYLLVVGRVPYDADSAVAVGIKHISDPIPRLPNNIIVLQPIIDKLLAKEPSARYQTGAELVSAIDELQNTDEAAIKSIARRRSPSGIGSHVTEAPTLVSANVKAVSKFNPDNTTMPAIASAQSPKTQKVRVTKSPSLKTTTAQSKVPTRSGSISSVSNPAVSNSSASNPAVSKRRATPTPDSVPAVTGRQSRIDKQNTTGSTKVVPPLANSQGTQKVNSGEFFAVDQDDVRDYSEKPSPKKYAVALLFIGFVGLLFYGIVFFKDELPSDLRLVVDNGIEKVGEVKNTIYKDLGWPVTEQQINSLDSAPDVQDTVAEISEGTEKENSDQPIDINDENIIANNNEVKPLVTNSSSTPNDTDIIDNYVPQEEQVDYEKLLADVPEGGELAKARILRDQLNEDLSVALPLAGLYRGVLESSPGDKKAEWGLEELKGFHFRRIRESLSVRDVHSAKEYISSLKTTFSNIETDEKYQQALNKVESAEKAQAYIVEGDEYFAQGRLVSPKGYNALEFYRKALSVDEGNPNALAGIEKISRQYEVLSNSALEENDYKKAADLASKGLKVNAEDEALNTIYDTANALYQKEGQIDEFFEEAEKQIAIGNLLSPYGESAYHQYQKVLEVDSENSQAKRALKGLEQIVSIEVEQLINRSNYSAAREMLVNARSYFPSVEKFLALQVSLERSEEADFIARQPIISQLVVSSQPLEQINQPVAATSNLDRTIYIGFSYENFQTETTVVQAVLYDVARSFQIAQVPVVVSNTEGFKAFSIARPVEGFAEGGYNIDLTINGQPVGTLAFRVENRNTSEAAIE